MTQLPQTGDRYPVRTLNPSHLRAMLAVGTARDLAQRRLRPVGKE